jgi:hypothetical protein
LGRFTPHKPAIGLADGAAHATLQAARAVRNLVQRRPQLAPHLAAVGCGEALPCRVAPHMGREGVEVRSIAVAERPAKSDVRAKPTMQQLGDFAFQFVALEQ